MNSETRLTFPLDVVPQSGTLHAINEHVRWIRMPLPMSLNHINLWGLGTKDNLTLVDTGMHLDDTKNAWLHLIDQEQLSIKNVVVTNILGEQVKSSNPIKTSSLSKGTYIIDIEFSNGSFAKNKLIIHD